MMQQTVLRSIPYHTNMSVSLGWQLQSFLYHKAVDLMVMT